MNANKYEQTAQCSQIIGTCKKVTPQSLQLDEAEDDLKFLNEKKNKMEIKWRQSEKQGKAGLYCYDADEA